LLALLYILLNLELLLQMFHYLTSFALEDTVKNLLLFVLLQEPLLLHHHGFLLSGSHWDLSPAYDINPVPDQAWLSLAVDFDDPSRDLRHALDVAEYFRLTSSQAIEFAEQIQGTIKKYWPILADKYHITKNEQNRMSPAFTECERALHGESGGQFF